MKRMCRFTLHLSRVRRADGVIGSPLLQSRLIGDPGHFNSIKLYQKQHQDENIYTVYELPKFSNFFIILIQTGLFDLDYS
jgi:hypothetical protein